MQVIQPSLTALIQHRHRQWQLVICPYVVQVAEKAIWRQCLLNNRVSSDSLPRYMAADVYDVSGANSKYERALACG